MPMPLISLKCLAAATACLPELQVMSLSMLVQPLPLLGRDSRLSTAISMVARPLVASIQTVTISPPSASSMAPCTVTSLVAVLVEKVMKKVVLALLKPRCSVRYSSASAMQHKMKTSASSTLGMPTSMVVITRTAHLKMT